jgi:hypothetical protein
MGFVQAIVDVGPGFVMNVSIKRFELIYIYFALVRGWFYADTRGKLVKMPVLLLFTVLGFQIGFRNLFTETSMWECGKYSKRICT